MKHTNDKIEISDEVIRGCASGDKKCQREIYELYYNKMYGVCLRYGKNADEAKDLLHEGFLKVFRTVASFKGDSDFYHWIKRVFTNNCIDHLRSAYKKNIVYVDQVYTDDQAEEEEIDDDQVLNTGQVFKAMNELRPDYRLILNLYAIENYSHQEIAEHLGIKESSSRSKLLRARRSLNKLLKRDEPRK